MLLNNFNKQINFLVGIPRAGNTVFSSIINQNPKMKSTANSVVFGIVKSLILTKMESGYQNFPLEEPFNNVCDSIIPSYYKDWKENYILDRGPWGVPPHLEFLQRHYKGQLKFIILVRSITEVLQSYIKHSNENKNAFINRYNNTVEEKCNALMNIEGLIMAELVGIHNLTQVEQNKHMSHLIEYNDLISKPKETIKGVYDFLSIPYFNHNFESFEQFNINGQEYNDEVVGDNLHKVRENGLSKTIHEPLPQSVLEKYSNCEFWRNNENKNSYFHNVLRVVNGS